MISDSQLSKVAAGGSDKWVENTLPSKKERQVGLSQVTHFTTGCLPSMPIHGSSFKESDVNGTQSCL